MQDIQTIIDRHTEDLDPEVAELVSALVTVALAEQRDFILRCRAAGISDTAICEGMLIGVNLDV
jgi:hypothetical protein